MLRLPYVCSNADSRDVLRRLAATYDIGYRFDPIDRPGLFVMRNRFNVTGCIGQFFFTSAHGTDTE